MVRRQQAADQAVRLKLRPPGHPKFQRPVEVAFWVEIAKDLLTIEASAVVGDPDVSSLAQHSAPPRIPG